MVEEENFEGESQRGLLKWDNTLPTFSLGVNNNNNILDVAVSPSNAVLRK